MKYRFIATLVLGLGTSFSAVATSSRINVFEEMEPMQLLVRCMASLIIEGDTTKDSDVSYTQGVCFGIADAAIFTVAGIVSNVRNSAPNNPHVQCLVNSLREMSSNPPQSLLNSLSKEHQGIKRGRPAWIAQEAIREALLNKCDGKN